MVAINPRSPSGGPQNNAASSVHPYKRFGLCVLKVLLIFTCFVLYLVLIPPFLLLISPLYLYRLFVICLAKLFKPELVKIVGPRDGVVGLDDVTQKCLCMLNVLTVVDGEPDLPAIREHFMKNVMNVEDSKGLFPYRKFKYYYKPWLGYAFWRQEDNFRIEQHLRFCEETEAILARSNNNEEPGVISEAMLLKVLGDLATKPFPPKMSPWEMIIVRNYVPAQPQIHTDFVPTTKTEELNSEETEKKKKQFVIVFRSHHALCDGYSLMKLIMVNWCGGTRESVPTAPVIRRSFWNKVAIYTGILALSPYYHFKQFIFDVDRNFWHISRGKLSREWVTIVSEKIPTKHVKEIGRSAGVSTSSVLLAGLGGAIRRYLVESGQAKKIPRVMNSLAPMPWQGHPMDGLVNHWTLGFLALPTGYDCPRERLAVANKSIQLLKTSPILLTNFVTVKFLQSAPLWLASIWATNWMTTAILSNFAGPEIVYPCFGKYPIHDIFFFLPQMRGTASLGIATLGINGGIRATFTIDKSVVPNQEAADKLALCINKEMMSLKSSPAIISTKTV